MRSKSIATLTLVLRIFTLFFAVASFLFLLKNKIEFKQNKVTFKFGTYRYVFYTGVIAATYALFQIPFAIYNLKNDKRMIKFLRKFDFYADGLISILLGTGVEAGFAVTNELKQLIDHVIFEDWGTDDPKSAFAMFLNKVYGGTGLLLGAFICMIVLLALSSANRNARDAGSNNNYTASIQL